MIIIINFNIKDFKVTIPITIYLILVEHYFINNFKSLNFITHFFYQHIRFIFSIN